MSEIHVDILIPLFYNPDENGIRREIEYEKFTDTYDELLFHFGGYSVDRDIVDGSWLSSMTNHRIDDQLRKVWVICEDKPEHVDFLKLLKDRLAERFEQEEIFMFYTTVNRF